MRVAWTSKALGDLERVRAFLAPVNPRAAAAEVRKIIAGAKVLAQHPRIGSAVTEFAPREVRRLVVRDYELRYELSDDRVLIVRLWHTREDR